MENEESIHRKKTRKKVSEEMRTGSVKRFFVIGKTIKVVLQTTAK